MALTAQELGDLALAAIGDATEEPFLVLVVVAVPTPDGQETDQHVGLGFNVRTDTVAGTSEHELAVERALLSAKLAAVDLAEHAVERTLAEAPQPPRPRGNADPQQN
jgi:hypothetical protein